MMNKSNLDYFIIESNGSFKIYEDLSGQFIATDIKSASEAKRICEKLNKNSPFEGFTPIFFLKPTPKANNLV
jgi:regulator of sigma D